MQFSDKLKMARHQQHYTQTQVAEQLHVSPKTISSWENARSFPDIGTLVKISDFYDISLDRLLREDQTMMDHYEAIDKQAIRDKRIFQFTYFTNLILLLGIVSLKMLTVMLPWVRQYAIGLSLIFIVNLIVLATHYPDYHQWVRSRPRLALIFIGLYEPITVPGGDNSYAQEAYIAGSRMGIVLRGIAVTFSTIFIVFGSEEILDKN
jgi:transcriptional regulator with XRE-family HTH domain